MAFLNEVHGLIDLTFWGESRIPSEEALRYHFPKTSKNCMQLRIFHPWDQGTGFQSCYTDSRLI